MNRLQLVIAGGGLTAARAIKSYRHTGGVGRIALLSKESVLPYHRPALSKRYLRGESSAPFAEDEAFYRDHDVDVLLETAVTALDIGARSIATERGDFRYDKLLISTGARPRHLQVPGAALEGVYALRTLHDSDRIREAARIAERAVVVGGGFIGMEVAASLRQLGLEVTLIHLGHGLFDQLGSRELSDQLSALYRDHGVDVLLEQEVARFGGNDRLAYVAAKSGLCVEADLAVSASVSSPTSTSSRAAASGSTTASSSTNASRPPLPASTPPATSPTSSTRCTDVSAESSTGRTPTTRAPRSARSSPAPVAATTPSPRSSARSSG
jgi:3-phenylpropionate/trans-cinnamate dioxygenase ferredoxin reductase component